MRIATGWLSAALAALTLTGPGANAVQLDVNDPASIKAAAKLIAANMMSFYSGNKPGNTPGLLPGPYYWWEAGAMFGQLINYWNLTGDTQYNDIVSQALQFQVGDDKDYMPANQTADLGNDDQVFWAFSAMDAAEANFPNPAANQPSWLALAQAVWTTQIARWDPKCNGGLRWQIYQFNAGYDYKNSISTGGLFQLSARLARYTGNQTYADWANKAFDWMASQPLLPSNADNTSISGIVWDGVYITNQCASATQVYWTYNSGTMISGAAYMYNYTNGSALWAGRLGALISGSNVFFVKSAGLNNPPANAPANGLIMAEVACEFPANQLCNYDEPAFKAFLSRWMAVATQLAPSTASVIMPRLQGSAQAAAALCVNTQGGTGANMCPRRWYQTETDGYYGVGEQMSALSIIMNNLITTVSPPLTAFHGGTSVGDPNAGVDSSDSNAIPQDASLRRPITTADQAGAGILTVMSVGLVIGGTLWMTF